MTYLSCPLALPAYVPTRSRTLNYCVATCLRVLIFQIPIYAYVPIYVFRAYVPHALNNFVSTWTHFSRAYVPTITREIY